ncbi:MAG: FAD-dependent oxidoreductase [Candidatus Omnitrophica bacterium]|nr:FAD-dependent oxidoreductase [Candidatus Omnitrophota bacterium]
MYELIIIGAGPSGITASVYAARKRLNFIVLTKDIGGQSAWSGEIENYTGYQFITGPELAQKFEEHVRKYNVEIREGEEVIRVKRDNDGIEVVSNKGVYKAKTVIISSGKRSRELNVPGEKEFKNRGLTYCATCDGLIFSEKKVAVIGGGNSALDAGLQMARIAQKIYLVNISSQITGDKIMLEKLMKYNNVEILNNRQVLAILGEKMVKGIKIKDLSLGKEDILGVEGVFVEIGLIPNSEFALDVEKNQFGEIKVNCLNETNIPGIFSAGDVTNIPEKQIIIASGEGAKACLSAFRYLSTQK